MDDNHTIVDMSGVRSQREMLLGRHADSDATRHPSRARGGQPGSKRDFSDELQDGEEHLMVVLGTLKAALGVYLVYVIGFGVVIALMLALWR